MEEGERLHRMYLEEHKSIRTIAKELGWSKSRVAMLIKKHGIPARRNGWSFKKGETSSSLKIRDNRTFIVHITNRAGKPVAKIGGIKPTTIKKIMRLLKECLGVPPQKEDIRTFTVRIEEQWKDKTAITPVITEMAYINTDTAKAIVAIADKKLLTTGRKPKQKKAEVSKFDVTTLYRLYVLQKLTPEVMADKLGCDSETVIEQLRKNHIISKTTTFE